MAMEDNLQVLNCSTCRQQHQHSTKMSFLRFWVYSIHTKIVISNRFWHLCGWMEMWVCYCTQCMAHQKISVGSKVSKSTEITFFFLMLSTFKYHFTVSDHYWQKIFQISSFYFHVFVTQLNRKRSQVLLFSQVQKWCSTLECHKYKITP